MNDDCFNDVPSFLAKIRDLRIKHGQDKERNRKVRGPRRPLSSEERTAILSKTDTTCHLCGRKIESDDWQADHVLRASHGGGGIENFLKEIAEIDAELRSTTEASTAPFEINSAVEQVVGMAKRFRDSFEGADPAERREMLRPFLRKVVVDPVERRVDVELFKVPLPEELRLPNEAGPPAKKDTPSCTSEERAGRGIPPRGFEPRSQD